MEPGLYLVGTPIGNLDDITLRAVKVLGEADAVLAEDTRHTRKLFARHNLHTPLLSCHKFNEASRVEAVVRRIAEEGAAIALVSNAGMPAVSDPGARIVTACSKAGLPVKVVPGPSAVSSAVALSGLGDAGFHFEGFLSHKGAARRRRLGELAEVPVPVVVFESPHRLLKLVDEVEDVLGERTVFVAREMTKRFEEVISGTPQQLRDRFAGRAVKGEIVVVLAPAPKRKKGKEAQPAPTDRD